MNMNKYIAIIIMVMGMVNNGIEGRGQVPIAEIRGSTELIYGVDNVISFEITDSELFNKIDLWFEMSPMVKVKSVSVNYSFIFDHNDITVMFAADSFSSVVSKSIEFVIEPTTFDSGTILLIDGYLFRGDRWESLQANPFNYSVVIPEPHYWLSLLGILGWGLLYRYKK